MEFLSKQLPSFAKALRWLKKEVNATWTTVWGQDTSDRVNPANLMDNDKNWVYVCVDKIADSVSAIPLKLMRYNKNGEDEEIFDHPAIDLLDKPNEQMTGRDFRYVTMAHLELTGNAYWLKDTDGQPRGLFPLNPRNVTPKLAKDGQSIEVYKYRAADLSGGSREVEYTATRIIHPKYPNPRSPLIGRGTLEPIAEWVDVDNYATEFNRRFFLNSANFGGALETEASTPEAQETLRASLENNHRGLQHAHKLLILPKGVKLNDQGMTPHDMQMKEADSTFRDKILAAFGVPKSVVGIVEDVNRANAESSNYVFTAFTIKPKMERLITYLNEFYLPLFKGTEQMYFTFDDPTPQNATLHLEENKAALANAPYMTVNEVRATKGLAPVEGGDVLLSPANLFPMGTTEPYDIDEVEDADEPAKQARPKQKRAPRIDRRAKVAESVADKIVTAAKDLMQKNEMEVLHKQFIDRVTHYELQVKKAFIDHDRKQQQDVIATVRNLGTGARIKPTQLFDKTAEIQKIVDFAQPIFLKLAQEEGARATDQINKGQVVTFLRKDYAVSSRLEKIITASVKRMARRYTQTTLNTLITRINDAIAEGDSIDTITDKVSEVYGLTETYRAERVARTETFSAANDASKDAFIQSGVVKTMRWKTAEDELTCEECGPLNNKVISVEESFFEKGDTTASGRTVEYENVENPPLHPNCRCYILPEEISVKSAEPVKHKGDDVWELLNEAVNE